MSGREITELVLEIQNGSGDRYRELLPALRYRVKETVKNVMGGLPNIEQEEVIEDCCSVGTVQAVRVFDPDKGAFLTLFYRVVWTILSNKMKTLGTVKNQTSVKTISFTDFYERYQVATDSETNTNHAIECLYGDDGIDSRGIHCHYILNRIKESVSPKTMEILHWILKGYSTRTGILVRVYGALEIGRAKRELETNPYAKRLLMDMRPKRYIRKKYKRVVV